MRTHHSTAIRTPVLVALALSACLLAQQVPPAEAQALDAGTVEKIKDAVVLVDVTLTTPRGETGSSGSGFVISPTGEIVANAHVVSMVTRDEMGGTVVATDRTVQVVFHPGTAQEKIFPAEVLREHHEHDLALLKIEPATPVYLDLADSDAVAETSAIYACGHPLGLREISIRTGTVTARRTWEGKPYIEHDASAEEGNSGGPVLLPDARVIGVHTLALVSSGTMTKLAIPSNVVTAWLATDAAADPPPPIPGKAIRELLAASNLSHEEWGEGSFSIPYDNDVTLVAHEYDDFLRLYCELGQLPGTEPLLQGLAALEALRFNYADPIGRLSLWDADEGDRRLYWECQVPLSSATPDYLRTIADIGALQVARWQATLRAEQPEDPDALYPGGTEEEIAAMLEGLGQQITDAGLVSERNEATYEIPYDNDVLVRSTIYAGMVWTYAYTGGMPGGTAADQGQIAIELLKRNWDDPLGRLSLDGDNDICWESQVPASALTPDYIAIVAGTAASQVADFIGLYGQIPFNG
jgi:S1-C subfamily serine protease